MRREKGSILVFTVMAVAVLMLVGVSFISLASAEYMANVMTAQRIRAGYIAEAGLAYGVAHLRVPANRGTYDFSEQMTKPIATGHLDIGGGQANVRMEYNNDQWELVSSATVGNSIRTMRWTIVLPTPPAETVFFTNWRGN